MADLLVETFTGANNDPWNATNWTTAELTGTSSATIQSNAGRLIATGGAYTGICQECDLAATTATGILCSLTLTDSSEQYPTICLRGSGTVASLEPNNSLMFWFVPTTNEVNFNKIIATVRTALSTSPDAWTATTAKQWIRMEFEGTTARVKWWLDGAGEPGWLMTDTVADAALASGKVYLNLINGGAGTARTATFDDVTIYDTFPVPPPEVSFVAAGSFAGNITVATQNIVAPACAAGDILIAAIINKSVTANAVTPPDGTWTAVIATEVNDCTTAADDHQYSLYWKRATGSGGTFTFTKAVDDNLLFGGVIVAYRGCVVDGSPLDATAAVRTETVGAADNVTFPAYDPVSTNNRVIYVAYYGNDLTTFAAAMSADTNPDCTKDCDVESALGNDCSIAFTSGTNDGSSIAGRTWASASTTDAGNTGVVFALVAQIPPAGRLVGVGQAVQRAAVR